MKVRVSVAAYNEISTALERAGVKADGSTELTLEKGTQLACPIDFKMATIRRDVAAIAAQCYKDELKPNNGFVKFCEELTEWVVGKEKVKDERDALTYKGWK